MTRVSRWVGCLAAGLLLLTGCTSGPHWQSAGGSADAPPAAQIRLVAFDSCADLLQGLRTAAKAAVGPYGFGGGGFAAAGPERAGAVPDAAAPQPAAPGGAKSGTGEQADQTPDFSGTNTHEVGVDEPDLVKTDGRRIVTLSGGVLRVVDAASQQVTGSLRLDNAGPNRTNLRGVGGGQLLLAGDRALVLVPGYQLFSVAPGPVTDGGATPSRPIGPVGPQLLLVDLAGGVRVTGRYAIDGSLVDARQVDHTVRVVVRSTVRLAFDYGGGDRTEASRIAENQAAIDRAPAETWLPRYAVDDADGTRSGTVDCTAVSRPAHYTGTSLLTVLTFDLGKATMGNGDPISVAADGEIVYGTGTSLYVANYADRPLPGARQAQLDPQRTGTELYKFDTADSAKPPRFVGAGSVPGFLLNQYAMSEWQGNLRLATTSAPPWLPAAAGGPVGGGPAGSAGGGSVSGGPVGGGPGASRAATESAVYVLRQRGGNLVQTGHVGGLGRGERIYAVRFIGGTGYVVTFRRTDPLYALDLRDPGKPAVTGELKINGYSAYLHPAGDGRLLGIGQEATDQGRIQGTQVSLFDVADPAHTARLAQYHVKFAHSEAEFDPHAFLYWPGQRLLVVPLMTAGVAAPTRTGVAFGALALHVEDSGFTELATITHPVSGPVQRSGVIRRSLMIGDILWTVSDAGLAADRPGKDRVAWVPFA